MPPVFEWDLNREIMKKESTSETNDDIRDELRPEDDLDYRKSRPNHLAPRMDETRIMVVLDPDVAEVFTSSEAVNEALRGLIQTKPMDAP